MMTAVLLVLAVAGWMVAGRCAFGWLLDHQRVSDRDSLLDESEKERLQLRAWYERMRPDRAYEPVAERPVLRLVDDDGLSPVARYMAGYPKRVPGVPRPRPGGGS